MNSNHLNRQPQPTISDELLSAYLDDEISAQERVQIERALTQDPDTAWRLNALRQTVALVKELPRVTLPRSFTLSEADIAPSRAETSARAPWWRSLLAPLLLRNATAIAALLFAVLMIGDLAPRLASPAAPPAAVMLKAPATENADATPAQSEVTARSAAPQPTEQPDAIAAQTTPLPEATPEAAVSASGAAGQDGATPPAPPAPAVDASGPLVTTAPAGTAPVLELAAPADSAPASPVAVAAGPNWLRVAQALLALLTVVLFVAWRRTLSLTR